MMKRNILGILDQRKPKQRDLEKFEPLPLQLPLERAPLKPSSLDHQEKAKDDKIERGVWTIDL